MEYEERKFDCPHKQDIPIDMSIYSKMGKMPYFFLRWIMKKNISKIRAAMGGKSKDITKRKIKIEEFSIPGYKSPIKIRIYTPEEPNPDRPLQLFFHGGGWIGGSLWAVEEYCKGVTDQANCVTISVEYHLAPEFPFPEGLEDCYSTIKWAVSNREKLGVDLNQIIVSGDSAGGNFAAVLCFIAQERKEFAITKQILIYPATHLSIDNSDKSGMIKFTKVMYDLYLPNRQLMNDYRVSPALARSFKGLPKALLTDGEEDFLYSSVQKYAHLLDEAEIPVKLIIYKDTNHAFIDNTGNCLEANDFVMEAAKFIQS